MDKIMCFQENLLTKNRLWFFVGVMVVIFIIIWICLYSILKKRKHPYKTLALAGFIVVIDIPFVINEAYLKGDGYLILWDADTTLLFYGTILAFLGTIALGLLSLRQNNKSNSISHRLLDIEEERMYPYIKCNGCIKEDKNILTEADIKNMMCQTVHLNYQIPMATSKKSYVVPLYYLNDSVLDGQCCSSLNIEIKNISDTIIQSIEFISIDTNLIIENEQETQKKSFLFSQTNPSKTAAIYPNDCVEVNFRVNSNYKILTSCLYQSPTKFSIEIRVHTAKKIYHQQIGIDVFGYIVDLDCKFN